MKQYCHVAGFGAIGGFLLFAFGLWIGREPDLSRWLQLPLSIGLGAGASLAFIFIIANSDTKDAKRLLTLALVSGFCWEPVWEASRAAIGLHAQEERASATGVALALAIAAAKAVAIAPAEKRDELVAQLDGYIRDASVLAGQIDSRSALAGVQASAEELLRVTRAFPSELEQQRLSAVVLAQRTGATVDSGFLPETVAHAVRYFDRQAFWDVANASTPMSGSEEISRGVGPNGWRARIPARIDPEDLPPVDAIQTLQAGGDVLLAKEPDRRLRWFALGTKGRSQITVEANAQDADLVAALYDRESLQRIALDDDSGPNQNPRLDAMVDGGQYLIRISEYSDGELPTFTLSFRTKEPAR